MDNLIKYSKKFLHENWDEPSNLPKWCIWDFTKGYPFNKESGIYAWLDDNKKVIYVGEAKTSFGSRLKAYTRCEKRGVYYPPIRKEIHRIAVLPLNRDKEFILKMEDYLIKHLNPFWNSRGVPKSFKR